MHWDKSGGHISVYGKAPLDAESPPAIGDTVMLTEGSGKHWVTVTVTKRDGVEMTGAIKEVSGYDEGEVSCEMSVGESVTFHRENVKVIVRND